MEFPYWPGVVRCNLVGEFMMLASRKNRDTKKGRIRSARRKLITMARLERLIINRRLARYPERTVFLGLGGALV